MTEILVLDHLKKLYKKGGGIRDINMHIKPHTIHGFLGLNGAGKTTTMKCIMGLLNIDSGSMFYDGEEYVPSNPNDKKNIGFSPELPSYPPYFTGEEIMRVYGRIKGLSKDIIARETMDILRLVGLESSSHKKVGKYSRGMQAKLGVAVAMLGDPDLLILDEPTSGMDASGAANIRDLFNELKKSGKTIMLSSHLLFEVQSICDNVTIINAGKTIIEGATEDIISNHTKEIKYTAEFNSINNKLIEELLKLDGVTGYDSIGGNKISVTVVPNGRNDIREQIALVAQRNGIVMLTCTQEYSNLEQIFLKIVNSDGRSGQ